MIDQSTERCVHCDHHVTRLCDILRHDRVYVPNTNLCGTILFADDQVAFIGLDNTRYETTFAIQQLRLIGH
jgi:hypothetical protein